MVSEVQFGQNGKLIPTRIQVKFSYPHCSRRRGMRLSKEHVEDTILVSCINLILMKSTRFSWLVLIRHVSIPKSQTGPTHPSLGTRARALGRSSTEEFKTVNLKSPSGLETYSMKCRDKFIVCNMESNCIV